MKSRMGSKSEGREAPSEVRLDRQCRVAAMCPRFEFVVGKGQERDAAN